MKSKNLLTSEEVLVTVNTNNGHRPYSFLGVHEKLEVINLSYTDKVSEVLVTVEHEKGKKEGEVGTAQKFIQTKRKKNNFSFLL